MRHSYRDFRVKVLEYSLFAVPVPVSPHQLEHSEAELAAKTDECTLANDKLYDLRKKLKQTKEEVGNFAFCLLCKVCPSFTFALVLTWACVSALSLALAFNNEGRCPRQMAL